MLKNFLAGYLPPDLGSKDKIFLALNLSIPVLIGLYIFVNPLPLSIVNEISFYLSCAALIVLLIFRETNFTLRSPMTLPFALFLLWAVFGLFFALDLKNSTHDLRSHLLEYLIVFYLLVNFFTTQKRLDILSLILIAGATIFSIGGMVEFYIIENFSFSQRFGETFKEMYVNYSCFITVFAALLAVRHFHQCRTIPCKALFTICCLANIIASLLTQSRSSFLGLTVSLIILCFVDKRNFILLIVTLLLLLFFIPNMRDKIMDSVMNVNQNYRTKINRLSIEVIKDHPIFGIGFGMQTLGNKDLVPLEDYNRKLPQPYQQHDIIINSPHNMFLDIAVRTGLVGLILFMYILSTAVGMLWIIYKRNKNDEYFRSWVIYLLAGFMSFLVQSFFADAMFGPRVILFYTALAMITILWNLSLKNQQAPLNA